MAEYKRHQGHRQRMRERVQNYGLDSLADHEVLEYILYTTNAQRDTNEIAYNLLERFGDFASVLEASEEELCTVEGIGPTLAQRIVAYREEHGPFADWEEFCKIQGIGESLVETLRPVAYLGN